MVLKHRKSLQKSLCPVVICRYLCSSAYSFRRLVVFQPWTWVCTAVHNLGRPSLSCAVHAHDPRPCPSQFVKHVLKNKWVQYDVCIILWAGVWVWISQLSLRNARAALSPPPKGRTGTSARAEQWLCQNVWELWHLYKKKKMSVPTPSGSLWSKGRTGICSRSISIFGYLSIYTSLSLSLSLYIYIYIYIRERERESLRAGRAGRASARAGATARSPPWPWAAGSRGRNSDFDMTDYVIHWTKAASFPILLATGLVDNGWKIEETGFTFTEVKTTVKLGPAEYADIFWSHV